MAAATRVLDGPAAAAPQDTPDVPGGLPAPQLGALEARLIARFGPAVRPEEVRRCVAQIAVGYEDARVRTYLGILIERAATARLQAIVRQGSSPSQPVGQGGAA